jgi:hypothetical protein
MEMKHGGEGGFDCELVDGADELWFRVVLQSQTLLRRREVIKQETKAA